MGDFAEFEIDVKATGESSIILNGEQVSDRVASLSLQTRLGEPPLLTLHHNAASGPITGQGIVHVVQSDRSPAELIRQFLMSIDPAKLDQEVLYHPDVDAGPMVVALQLLMEWAK